MLERIVATFVSFLMAIIGLAFLLARPGNLAVGLLLFLFAGVVLFLAFRRRQPVVVQLEQKLEIGGPVRSFMLTCRNCGAEIDEQGLRVKDGAVLAQCPYCRTPFQLQEEPKW